MAVNEKDKDKDRDVTFDLKEHIGVLSTSINGWSRELNIVSWNGRPEKYDIREWSDNHTHLRKGITLTRDEARTLCGLLVGLGLA